MLARRELEQRLLLRRVGLEARRVHQVEEAVEDRARVGERGPLRHAPQEIGEWSCHQPFLAAKSFMKDTSASHPACGNAL